MPDNKEKTSNAKLIDFLEKNDPTGLAQVYYQTLIGKYEKVASNESIIEADRKALQYLEKNDPTGFIKYFYEETEIGKYEKSMIKQLDKKFDDLDRLADKGFKEFGKFINQSFNDTVKAIKELGSQSDNHDNNKNLPNAKNGIDRQK